MSSPLSDNVCLPHRVGIMPGVGTQGRGVGRALAQLSRARDRELFTERIPFEERTVALWTHAEREE